MTDTITHEPLLPCPFCGSTNLTLSGWIVECDNCECSGPEAECGENAEAVRLWNIRAKGN